jgi:polysaccharide deacetylase family protein (PEP-CTERM system associated)
MKISDNRLKSIFSVDVEDWFHILDVRSTPDISKWDSIPSYIEKNFMKLLDMFSETNVQSTCFFLGYVAKRFPWLVKEASARGHEIASHGYAHRLVYQMTQQEFLKDLLQSKRVLEDLIGQEVRGFRSAGFSVTEKSPWFYDMLIEANYRYDSSIFPAVGGHGGLKTANSSPHLVVTGAGRIIEFPITVSSILRKPFCFFGGGYLRFFPYLLVRQMAHRVLREGRPVVFYVHPREVDPGHPRLAMNLKRRFKSYVNMKGMERKIINILREFKFCTFYDFIYEHNMFAES